MTTNMSKNCQIFLNIFYLLVTLYFSAVVCRRDYIDGKYHNGIKDFELLVPHSSSEEGRFKSFDLNNFFELDFQSQRIHKRSLDDSELIHYGIWINGDLEQLDLWPNREFLNPNLVFEKIDNRPIHKRDLKNLSEKKLCYYTGKVHGYSDSTASISTCDGLLGNIRIEDTDYFIEPVEGYGSNDEGHHLHVIYDLTRKLYRKRRGDNGVSWCAVQDDEAEWETSIEERIKDSIFKMYNKRENAVSNRTAIKPKYMETTMVCDKAFIDFHKHHRDVDVYVLTAANMAFNAFRDASFGSEMTLSLVRVIYLEKEGQEINLNVSVSIDDTLASFNRFAEIINVPEDNPLHHDVAVLTSRVDMCNGPQLKDCVVCGIAKIGGVCKNNYSANVVEDDGVYELAMTMTHETGHLLGISHDGATEGLGKPCLNPTNTTGRSKVWIMSGADAYAVYFGWSECSRAMLGSFFRNGWGDCMNDEPEKTNKKFPHIPIGAIYDRDEQCYLSTIRKGKKFEANKTCGDPSECENLYCEYYGEDKGCRTMKHMVADGTPCGDNKWCWNSKCVPKGQRPDAVDGGWSDWTGWSECSRTCGGENPCQIACMNFKEKLVWSNLTVPNGEACDWGKKPKRRCLFGECMTIGCDNEIESSALTDDCGICNGDSTSCTVVEGRWKEKKSKSNLTQEVTTFPKGAFNIKIIEATNSKSKISILNANEKTVYINDYELDELALKHGHRVLRLPPYHCHFKMVWSECKRYYDVKISAIYPVTNDAVLVLWNEALEKVVYLEDNADFKWKYSFVFGNETVEKEERNYRWEQDDWTECSKVCGGGIQTPAFSCVEEKLGKVADNLCIGEDQPETETKACREQPCKTRWRVGQWGDCHACKEKNGMKARGVECMQENPEKGGDDILVEDEKCGEPKPHKYMLCSPKTLPAGTRTKRCTLGLPEKYMEQVWKQLSFYK